MEGRPLCLHTYIIQITKAPRNPRALTSHRAMVSIAAPGSVSEHLSNKLAFPAAFSEWRRSCARGASALRRASTPERDQMSLHDRRAAVPLPWALRNTEAGRAAICKSGESGRWRSCRQPGRSACAEGGGRTERVCDVRRCQRSARVFTVNRAAAQVRYSSCVVGFWLGSYAR